MSQYNYFGLGRDKNAIKFKYLTYCTTVATACWNKLREVHGFLKRTRSSLLSFNNMAMEALVFLAPDRELVLNFSPKLHPSIYVSSI